MKIEDNIFKRYSPDLKLLKAYGFIENNNIYTIEKIFKNNLFKAVIEINLEGKVSGNVYDLENDDEFLPLRVESNQGAFVGEVRAAYEDLLLEIREKCFRKKYFIYPQSNRIVNLIIEKYGDEPEFLWKTTPGSGVIRNPETKKWYIAMLDVDRSKLESGKSGIVEVANVKLKPEHVQSLLKEDNFYAAYHMNKKSWISIILDESVSDEKIMKLIDESHSFTEKKCK